MYRLTDKIYFGILCLLLIPCAFALPTDKEQQLFFRADSVDINQATHHGLYIGQVELDQGSTHIRAHMVITDGDKDHQITKATLKGNTGAQAHYWVLTTQDKPPLHAFADVIYYFPERHMVELVGHAKVEQGDNLISGAYICYNTQTQHVVSNSGNHMRTTIVLHPEKKT